MTLFAELVGSLSEPVIVALFPAAVALALWPAAALAARLAGRRDRRPAVNRQTSSREVSFQPGRAAVRRWDATLIDLHPIA